MTNKKGKKKPRKPTYQGTLKVAGQYYHGQGDTVAEVIASISIPKAMGVGVLVIEGGGVKKEKILPRITLQRLFAPAGALVKSIAVRQAVGMF